MNVIDYSKLSPEQISQLLQPQPQVRFQQPQVQQVIPQPQYYPQVHVQQHVQPQPQQHVQQVIPQHYQHPTPVQQPQVHTVEEPVPEEPVPEEAKSIDDIYKSVNIKF